MSEQLNHAERVEDLLEKLEIAIDGQDIGHIAKARTKLYIAIEAMQAEIERLTACIKKANDSAE